MPSSHGRAMHCKPGKLSSTTAGPPRPQELAGMVENGAQPQGMQSAPLLARSACRRAPVRKLIVTSAATPTT